MKTIKTQITRYCFNIGNLNEKIQHEKLLEELKKTPGRGMWMHCISGPPHKRFGNSKTNGTFDVELETNFLFENQWNTVATEGSKGERVFDWYEEYVEHTGSKMRFGHYLTITQEMVDIRNNTLVCGYTGQHFRDGDRGFMGFNTNKSAIGSEYLKEDELHLLRLMPVSFTGNRPKLSEEEKAALMPIYLKAKTECSKERRVKLCADKRTSSLQSRDDAIAEAERKIAAAKKKCDAILWLIDHDIETEDCIFYDHTNMFEFGWRGQGLSQSVAEEFKKKLKDFPHQYEIKVAK